MNHSFMDGLRVSDPMGTYNIAPARYRRVPKGMNLSNHPVGFRCYSGRVYSHMKSIRISHENVGKYISFMDLSWDIFLHAKKAGTFVCQFKSGISLPGT